MSDKASHLPKPGGRFAGKMYLSLCGKIVPISGLKLNPSCETCKMVGVHYAH